MELVKSECPECRAPKKVTVSLASDCGECGLDSFGITYEIPADKVDAVIRAIFDLLDTNAMRPLDEEVDVLTYDELMKRLGV